MRTRTPPQTSKDPFAVVYAFLTGKRPYESRNPYEMIGRDVPPQVFQALARLNAGQRQRIEALVDGGNVNRWGR